MAGLQLEKFKSSGHLKAVLRHDDKELREQQEHKNEHINTNETHKNINIDGLTYSERCVKYDNRIKEIDNNGINKNTRKNRVTAVSFEIVEPKGLPKERQEEYFREMTQAIVDFYGGNSDNLIACDVHNDEIHDYIDNDTGKLETSRPHAMVRLIPELEGKLNAREYTKRANLVKLNKLIQELTLKNYGLDYTNPDKPMQSRNKSVELLKAQSAAKLVEINKETELKHKKNIEIVKKYKPLIKKLKHDQKALNEKEELLNAQEKSLAQERKNLDSQRAQDLALRDRLKIKEQTLNEKEDALKTQINALELIEKFDCDIEKTKQDLVAEPEDSKFLKSIKIKGGSNIWDKLVQKRLERKKRINLNIRGMFDTINTRNEFVEDLKKANKDTDEFEL